MTQASAFALGSGHVDGHRIRQPWVLPALPDAPGAALDRDRALARYDRAGLKQATIEARSALQEAAIAAAVAAQRAFTYAEKLDEALAALNRAEEGGLSVLPAVTATAAPRLPELSPRERDVLALVAEGRSNKAIAESLFVSPNTVKTHVASLLNKLNAGSRAQLAAIAVRGAVL